VKVKICLLDDAAISYVVTNTFKADMTSVYIVS